MQYKAIWKDTFRELSKSIMRFLAILIIIFLGVGFYVGISATSPNMLWTSRDFYEQNNLMDYRVLSTYGLTEEDIADINDYSGVTTMAQYANDFIVDDYLESIRLYSYDLQNGQKINDYHVVDGRLPKQPGEIALDSREGFLRDLSIGDTIQLQLGEEVGNPEENLHRQTFEVVGFVMSPMFIEVPTRGNTTVGNGTLDGFGVIARDDYNMEVYTDAFLRLEAAKDAISYSEAYDEYIVQESDGLEELLAQLERRRSTEIQNEIETEINDGWIEIEKAEQELADAEAELTDARATLDEGWAEYETGVAEFEEETAAARQELNQNEALLQQNLSDLNAQEQTLIQQRTNLQNELTNLNKLEEDLLAGKSQLESGLTEIDGGIAQIENNLSTIDTSPENIQHEISSLEQMLTVPGLPEEQITQLEETIEALNTLIDLRLEKADLQIQLEALLSQEQNLIVGRSRLEAGITQINNGLNELENGRVQINDGLAQITQGRRTLAEGSATAEAELLNAETELNEGEAEYQDGLSTFQQEEADALKELEEARQELEEATADLQDLPMPEYLLFDRSDNPGYLEYKDNADRLSIIAMVFPWFFFLIAIFISFTTMTRMVDEEREYIGIMKALGYGNQQILIKFLTYAILATTAGAILGLLAGYTFIPKIIFYAYESMYMFPDVLIRGYSHYTAIALIAAFVSTVGASLLAVRYSLRNNAAELLQPKAPRSGSRIWLERLPFIWRRLSFNYKITFRNVFRYKSRMFMTIFGIAGSTGLILTGFGISDSISDIPSIQYGEINQFQAYVALDQNLDENELTSHMEFVESDDRIDDSLFVTQVGATARQAGTNNQTVSLFVPNEPERINQFIALNDVDENYSHSIEDTGVLITQKLAQLYAAEVGDTLTLMSDNDEEWTVKIVGILENYIGHTIYMSPKYFETMSGKTLDAPNLHLISYDTNAVDETEIGRDLMNTDEVIGINYVSDVSQAFGGTLESLELITHILVVSAAALAFIVLYNLTNINVSERKRELSTIKVLGSYDHEVTMYIYRENIILSILGIIVGLLFGTFLTTFIMGTMEVDMLVFGRTIHLSSYFYSIFLTIAFSLIVMLVIHHQLKRINMVEALKAND